MSSAPPAPLTETQYFVPTQSAKTFSNSVISSQLGATLTRPLLRDAQAEIKPGPAHPFTRAGGYAKITRLAEPATAAFIEFHLIYEEPYGWFDGINLVKQKIPAMVQEKVRTFRRKLAVASEKKGEEKTKQ